MDQLGPAITAVLHIDLSAVAENYRLACRLAGHARVAAVVKSDAYGLGIEQITQCLAEAGCRRFLVTSLVEADRVRHVAPDATVMVLQAGLDEPFPPTAPLGVLPVANSIDCIHALVSHHRPYVLNVESGFSRLGVSFDGLRRLTLAGFLRDHPPSMIMTHLACSETPAAPVNLIQKQRFSAACTLLPRVPASLGASATL
jgi:alanine racemase